MKYLKVKCNVLHSFNSLNTAENILKYYALNNTDEK